jgi:hypothetical protein
MSINFKTTYQGKEMSLNVIAINDQYSVLQNDKPIGHIKLGDNRHTWIVVDSVYVAPQLVNEIANRIAAAN